jgi:hypothetical protein
MDLSKIQNPIQSDSDLSFIFIGYLLPRISKGQEDPRQRCAAQDFVAIRARLKSKNNKAKARPSGAYVCMGGG